MKPSLACSEISADNQLRGNLHAHTTISDGSRPPQEVLNDYAARGYDFLMLSDHDHFASPEELAGYDARGMTLIPGNEISAGGSHILHVNAARRVEPHIPRQRVFNEIAVDGGGFAIACHPNWLERFDHTSIAQLMEWTGYPAMEIYNGTIGRLAGSPYATNKWDMLLGAGRRVWGCAHDDSHLPEKDVGLGWNMVCTNDRSIQGILQAMLAGHFYASTGVVIKSLVAEGNRARIETENARRITALHYVGQRIAQADATSLEVEITEAVKTYIRFECWGDGEQFAWSQPIYLE